MSTQPENAWVIRKAHNTDAQALSVCMTAAYADPSAKLDGAILPPMAVNYGDEIRNYPVWVAESQRTLIGGLILIPEKDHMTIANVAVDPDAQGLGVGKALLAFAEKQAIQEGFTEMRLATHVAFTENIAFYLHLGWTETMRDETRVYMSKPVI